MLLVGALTVSFAAQAAVVQDGTRSENPIEETDKATDANLFGHVVDTKTGEHLPYVTIQLKGTTIGTTTDHTGHYFLKNLPEGTFTIVAKFLGYKTEERTVTVQHNTTQEVNFSLSTDDVAIDEVVVSANRNETARRLAPNLVSVVGSKVFDITQSTCLAQGSTSSLACAPRTIVRTAVSRRCASMAWTVTTPRSWSIPVPSSPPSRVSMAWSRFLPI